MNTKLKLPTFFTAGIYLDQYFQRFSSNVSDGTVKIICNLEKQQKYRVTNKNLISSLLSVNNELENFNNL